MSAIVLHPEFSAAAVVSSLNDAVVVSQVDAPLLRILPRVGDEVKAGAILAQVDCRDFELEHARLQAERQAIQSRLELTEWQLKQSEALAKQQSLPREQVEEKRSQRGVLRAELAAHSARLAISDRQIVHCNIKSPFDGIITARLAPVGQLVTRGTPLMRLLETEKPELSAQVPSRDIGALIQASTLEFEHDGRHFRLRLRAVLPVIRSESGTQEARLEFVDQAAEPGAAGRLLWRGDTPLVPAEFQVKRGDRLGIFTETAGTAHFHALTDAVSGRPAPIALPLESHIIVSGQFGLTDGAPVRLVPAQAR